MEEEDEELQKFHNWVREVIVRKNNFIFSFFKNCFLKFLWKSCHFYFLNFLFSLVHQKTYTEKRSRFLTKHSDWIIRPLFHISVSRSAYPCPGKCQNPTSIKHFCYSCLPYPYPLIRKQSFILVQTTFWHHLA